jgi:hypothetical protein
MTHSPKAQACDTKDLLEDSEYTGKDRQSYCIFVQILAFPLHCIAISDLSPLDRAGPLS